MLYTKKGNINQVRHIFSILCLCKLSSSLTLQIIDTHEEERSNDAGGTSVPSISGKYVLILCLLINFMMKNVTQNY